MRKLNLGSTPGPSSGDEWTRRFIELQLKELRQETLTSEEASFLARAELLMLAIPDALQNPTADAAAAESGDVYRVAASKSARLYDEVVRAIADGMDRLFIQANGAVLAVLRIDATEGRVEPLYVDGYAYRVTRRGEAAQVVGRLGGIVLGLEDLRDMAFTCDPEAKTIVLASV